MSSHDPLCRFADPGVFSAVDFYGNPLFCQCALIAKVVAREQERHGDNCGGLWDEWVGDLHAKVQGLPSAKVVSYDPVDLIDRADVLALLAEEDDDD